MKQRIKKKAEVHLASAVALQEQTDEAMRCCEGLKACRALLVTELKETQTHLKARIAKLDEEIAEAKLRAQITEAAADEQRRLAAQFFALCQTNRISMV